MQLTAIVPATDRPLTLDRCVQAIRTAADPPEEVVVVELPSRAGPAEARNLGAAQAAGEILVFVDADVIVRPDAFVRVREAFAADSDLIALFGSYDDEPEAGGAVSAFRNLLHHDVHQAGGGPAATFWAGLGAIRRDAFFLAGGFDAARYPRPSIEDVELGLRLSARGDRIELDPGLQGKHLKAWTLPGMVRTDFARRGVPWVELLVERRAGTLALNLGWQHRLSAVACVVGAVSLVRRRPAGVAAAGVALVLLNRSFYELLLRRLGPSGAVAGVGLHAVHHLTATAAVPAGLLAAARRRR